MKFTFALAAFATFATAVAGKNATEQATQAIPSVNCPPRNYGIILRRMWSGQQLDHFYSTNGPEIASYGPRGYSEEPPQGMLYPTQQPGTYPFFRCEWNTGTKIDHFYTADPGEFKAKVASGCKPTPLNTVNQGIGFIYALPYCGAIPLWRLFSSSRVDSFYTVSESERAQHMQGGLYTSQGIAGFVLPY